MEGNIITNIDTSTMDDDDRISELPDFIAHHILSFLVDSPKELIRTSVLSKRWLALHFNSESFERAIYPLWAPFDREYAKDIFFNYVGYTTSRFSQQQSVVSANTFDLCAGLEDPAHADIIDRCLGLILKQGLHVGINLTMMNKSQSFIDIEELKLLESSPFALEHIKLNVNGSRELSEYLPVVDAVLWCCRPLSLTLISYSYFHDLEKWNHIVKFTYEKLLEQEDQGQTNIQIVFYNLKAFRSNDLLITFLKEEVGQEAG